MVKDSLPYANNFNKCQDDGEVTGESTFDSTSAERRSNSVA